MRINPSENESVPSRLQNVQTNESMMQIKGKVIKYWHFVLGYMKNPVDVFQQGKNEFGNGMITAILFAVIAGVCQFAIQTNKDVSFLTVVSETALFLIIGVAIASTSLFVINKLFSAELSFKKMVGIYGTHMIASLILVCVTYILILVNFIAFGSALLVVLTSYTIFLLPLYILTRLLSEHATNIDPLYSYVSYIVMFSILYSIYLHIVTDRGVTIFFSNFLS
ncbi:hypothetical protein [Sporosarcina sp. HYO08]|uniref:hypothetical protein n=1 Tax=Sporosarcina sp. HYO08 TaxID=1759557 RepID=UPI000794CE46|nr:hypothetical protein [Sporosarcina sp. HYO08]KXH84078.1 hypothetical protein AU377_04825 [Sporosarcina sp. HYO08]